MGGGRPLEVADLSIGGANTYSNEFESHMRAYAIFEADTSCLDCIHT